MNYVEILNKHAVPNFGISSFTMEKISFPIRRSSLLSSAFQSILILPFPYYSNGLKGGNISYYASVPDYHTIVKNHLDAIIADFKKIFPQELFVPFVDSSPIGEVETAVATGLGVRGQHSMLITPDYGSYVFLGEIITTKKLPNTSPLSPATCINCNRCITHCPTQALSGDYTVKTDLCLSHITQKKGELTLQEQEWIKNSNVLWGCDICQTVCPMNQNKKETPNPHFLASIITTLTEEIIETQGKHRAFGFRGKQVLYRNISLLQSNPPFSQ